MKAIFTVVLISILTLTSCGSKECQECVRESYYNGVNYTEKETSGPTYCQEDDETVEQFENRMREFEKEHNYDCKIK